MWRSGTPQWLLASDLDRTGTGLGTTKPGSGRSDSAGHPALRCPRFSLLQPKSRVSCPVPSGPPRPSSPAPPPPARRPGRRGLGSIFGFHCLFALFAGLLGCIGLLLIGRNMQVCVLGVCSPVRGPAMMVNAAVPLGLGSTLSVGDCGKVNET